MGSNLICRDTEDVFTARHESNKGIHGPIATSTTHANLMIEARDTSTQE
jgi:hypothetical protein